MKRTIIPATAAALISTAAFAAAPSFDAVDANNDNKVTWQELSAAVPSASLFDFKAVDRNSDGSISSDEMTNNFDKLDLKVSETVVPNDGIQISKASDTEVMKFDIVDSNDDDLVSWDELSAAQPKASLYDFTELDTNGDGMLTELEIASNFEDLDGANTNDPVTSTIEVTPNETESPAPKDS